MIRIMIADDEEYEREYLARFIKEHYQGVLKLVFAAKDGAELLLMAQELTPEIIVMDIRMPRLDGLEAAAQLREKLPDTELVILSAYGQFSYAKQAMKLGVRDFLVKPYLDDELQETLNQLIAGMDLTEKEPLNEQSRNMGLLYEDADRDIVWDLAFQMRSSRNLEKGLQLFGIRPGNYKCIVFFHDEILKMGTAGCEVVRRFFARPSNRVILSCLFRQMVLFVFSEEELAYSDLNAAIRKTREYLAGAGGGQALCGISGTYRDTENTGKAFREAEAYIEDYALPESRDICRKTVLDIEELCGLQERLRFSLGARNHAQTEEICRQITGILRKNDTEDALLLRDMGRCLLSVIRMLNYQAEKRIPTEIALRIHQLFRNTAGLNGSDMAGKDSEDILDQQSSPEEAFLKGAEMLEKETESSIPGGNAMIVRKAKAYLQVHYGDQLGLQSVAAELKVSAGYLSKSFKAQEGISFTEYLTELRLENAKRLIREGKGSITEISYAVGFQDPGYFGKCFRKSEKISPSEYAVIAKQNKDEED